MEAIEAPDAEKKLSHPYRRSGNEVRAADIRFMHFRDRLPFFPMRSKTQHTVEGLIDGGCHEDLGLANIESIIRCAFVVGLISADQIHRGRDLESCSVIRCKDG